MFSTQLADEICERLADGESLRLICLDDHMPARSVIFRWLGEDQAFADQYARAREDQAESLADEIVRISDEEGTTTKVIKGAKGEDDEFVEVVFDSTAVARNKLRVDARKWVASKLKPKKYGDRTTTEHTGNLTITHEQWIDGLK